MKNSRLSPKPKRFLSDHKRESAVRLSVIAAKLGSQSKTSSISSLFIAVRCPSVHLQ